VLFSVFFGIFGPFSVGHPPTLENFVPMPLVQRLLQTKKKGEKYKLPFCSFLAFSKLLDTATAFNFLTLSFKLI